MLKTMAKAPAAPSLGQEGITEFGGNRKMARMLCHQKLSRNVENHPQIDQMASCCGSRHDMLKMQPCPSVHPVHPIRPLIHHPFTNCIHSNAHPPFPSQSRFHQSIRPSIHPFIHSNHPSPFLCQALNLKHYFFNKVKIKDIKADLNAIGINDWIHE